MAQNIKVFQVDAFASKSFEGNPAAVCPLDEWLEDDILQKIANEFNLSETAFCVKEGADYHLRWFTPRMEVNLCGHATLATAHIYFTQLGYKSDQIKFNTKSGALSVNKKANNTYELNFPCDAPAPVETKLLDALIDQNVKEAYRGKDDFLAILKDQTAVEKAIPDLNGIRKLGSRGLIISAAGNEKDFVSRCFYPQYGIDEDPATGSAHTLLTPYWAVKLNKNNMEAAQLSSRGAQIGCSLASERIILRGNAITVLEGNLIL